MDIDLHVYEKRRISLVVIAHLRASVLAKWSRLTQWYSL